VTRIAIEALVKRTRLAFPPDGDGATREFARLMATKPVAVHAEAANDQHYEVPAEFFGLVLGPRRKYSSCLYEGGAASLAEAELEALEATAANASLSDGQSILELGCGWGSLSLFMAERMPRSAILAVSNSHSQRAFIETEAEGRARQSPGRHC
jgi:cyclopropane-fatty-acyl-phospholipid synthase